jgi:hypothetical protein
MEIPVQFERRQRSYLEFAQGLKIFNATQGQPAIRSFYEESIAPAYEAAHGHAPADYLEVRPLVGTLPAWQFDRAINRKSQEIMWDGILDIVATQGEQMREVLGGAAGGPLGSLRINPQLELPRYYAETEFHLRPGGMWQGDLQGWYTTIANWVYFMGRNNALEDQAAAAASVPDRPYRRILDLACGTGQSTEPLKLRFPDAEVHGIPDKAARNVVAEAYRLLEPGGVFAIADIPPYKTVPAYQQFFTDWQTQNNGEVFWRAHGQRDLVQWMKDAGFSEASWKRIEGKTLGFTMGIK